MDKDDELNIDFSKFKKWFKKTTASIVEDTEDEAREIEAQTHGKAREEVQRVEKDLDKLENEARIVDAERELIEKRVKADRRKLESVRESDDEVSVDFSKIKTGFKNLLKRDKAQSGTRETKEVVTFIKNHQVTVLILIALFFTVFVRLYPAYLPVTDNWAQSTIDNNIRQQVTQQARAQYPNLPAANLNSIISEQVQAIYKENGAAIEQQAQGLSQQFKERLQRDGQTYLIAIDPYFWMQHASRVLENGHPGDTLRDRTTREECDKRSVNCVPWDDHMYAPLGRAVPPDMFHAYFGAFMHKIVTFFSPRTDIMTTMFYLPVILSALAVIPAFFITRRLGGNFGGFIAAFFVGIHPSLLTRTVAGFSDTDAYNVMFPLYIIWLFIEAFESKSWKKGVILSAASGVLMGIYPAVWGAGWWYIFDFILASVGIYLAAYLIIHREEGFKVLKNKAIKNTALVFSCFFVTSMIFTTISAGFGNFMLFLRGPLAFINIKAIGLNSVWPNVFTTVAEQNPASLPAVINGIGIGSIVFMVLALLGIAITLMKKHSKDKTDLYFIVGSAIWFIGVIVSKPTQLMTFLILIAIPVAAKLLWTLYKRDTEVDIKLAVVLIIWLLATIYASTKGVRYLLLLVPAFSIGLGIGFGYIQKTLAHYLSKSLYLNKKLAASIMIVILLMLMIVPFNAARSTAKNEIPSMNDAWYNALDKINLESEPDAIINSWWDFGHWFKAIGDRAVTFDGTSQNTPMAHWIGHVLLTNDEEKAAGILRMLDCGSNTAFNVLDADVKDTARSVDILHTIVAMEKEDARAVLESHVDASTASDVLEYTHCDAPENYFITSDDMIGKSGVWGHFGSWDFNRSLIYQKSKRNELTVEFLQDRFGMDVDAANRRIVEVKGIRNNDQANSWIAPWPGYASGLASCRAPQNGTVTCPLTVQGGSIDMIVDLDAATASMTGADGIVRYPDAIAVPTPEGIKKTVYTNSTIGVAATMVPQGDGWAYVLMQRPLEDSMFTRLYFLQGHGLSKFDWFTEENSVIGNRIVVWKLDWEGSDENVHPIYQVPEDNEEAP